MNWRTVFQSALIIDSAVFVLKFSVPVFLIWYGVEEKRLYDQREEDHPSDGITLAIIVLLLLAGSFLIVLILLRFLTNWHQFRNEKLENNSVENGFNYFCSSFFWFVISVGHIATDAAVIGLVGADERWLRYLAISFLSWQILIFCFMVTLRVRFCKGCSVDEQDEHATTDPDTVKE